MENNYHKKLATKKLLIFMLPLLFVGCMHMPAFRDYMADMGDDVFSDIVKASYTGYIYYEDPYVGRNTPGDVNKLHLARAKRLSKDIFVGKNIDNVASLFEQHGGKCAKEQNHTHAMECVVERSWTVENVGARFDMSNIPNPAVKMSFSFQIDANRNIRDLTLELMDATKYKPIMK